MCALNSQSSLETFITCRSESSEEAIVTKRGVISTSENQNWFMECENNV